MEVKRAYKFRFYPTPQQAEVLARTSGCARFAYNHMLRKLIGIDKWYPSSKRCSECGHAVRAMPLKVREWTCPECGSIHDRDINTARNVLAAGLAVSAHGETVSPVCM
jgi:transposase